MGIDIAERFAYLPSVFFCMAVGLLLERMSALWGKPWHWRIAIAATIALLMVLSAERNLVWRSNLTLYTDTAAKSPQVPTAQWNLAHDAHVTGEIALAIPAYQRYLALVPYSTEAMGNLAAAYISDQQPAAALKLLEACLRLKPSDENCRLNYLQLQQSAIKPRS
jgi:cytochrome c-type biogenesis protein CcmH/NrfG